MKSNKGAILIFTLFLIPILIGFCALVIDIGMLSVVSRQLQGSVDMAALAGVDALKIYWQDDTEPVWPFPANVNPIPQKPGSFNSLRKGWRRVKPRVRQMFIDQKIYGAPTPREANGVLIFNSNGVCDSSNGVDCSNGASPDPIKLANNHFDPAGFTSNQSYFTENGKTLKLEVTRYNVCSRGDAGHQGEQMTIPLDNRSEMYCFANQVKVKATLSGHKFLVAGVFESFLFGGNKAGFVTSARDITREAIATVRPRVATSTCREPPCSVSCGKPKCGDLFDVNGNLNDPNSYVPRTLPGGVVLSCSIDTVLTPDPDWP